MIVIDIAEDNAGRVDRALARRFPDAGKKQLAALFAGGKVRVGGRVAKKGDRVIAGMVIEVSDPPPAIAAIADPSMELAVLHRDPAVVVIAKPPGIPSQPLAPGEIGTIANAILAAFPECANIGRDPREAGLVHRLDIGTSGLLVAARTARAWTRLRAAFATGAVAKRYLAVVCGWLPERGRSQQALAHRGKKMIVTGQESGLPAETEWTVLSRADELSLVSCVARTGRMHQIRVHLAAAGAPILGDGLYGGPPPRPPLALCGHFLHAAEISFPHPETGDRVTFSAALPADRHALLCDLHLGDGLGDDGDDDKADD
ncbi:MAG TPA: RluA family pseudouridine synthase [Kofleriaceae bacterium]|nr:RluA family pseudouridine synthase [Kofleriaceae bacterium]